MKSANHTMFRQGDVLLIRTDEEIPVNAVVVPRDAGRIILAYGEATGHSHAVASPHAELFKVGEGALRLLKVDRPAVLQHEEHGEISLDPGVYKVILQREYSPRAIRRVRD